MRTVLIVSPHFPPANAADIHRVRMVLPFLREFGWQAHVLAVNPACLTFPRDPWMLEGLPDDVPVHHADALGAEYSWIPGLGSIDLRCRRAIRRLGDELLSTIPCDLIYFSTTAFGVFPLGRHWRRKFGIPFVLDYQDPWVTDFYRDHPEVVPPGGRLKYAIVDRLNRIQEPRVIKSCSGITSVSPAYPAQLQQRYPTAKSIPFVVLPFPGSTRDLDRVRRDGQTQTMFNPADGLRHWVYVGRGGGDMEKPLTGLFTSLARWKAKCPAEYQRTRLHFFGTSYASSDQAQQTILPIAAKLNVNDIVHESTDRIPFGMMLKCLADADGLIVPGSIDPAYTASKLYPYLLARKPLLTIFHRDSTVVKILHEVGGGQTVAFDEMTPNDQLANEITQTWFDDNRFEQTVPLDDVLFEPYTDRGSARQLCQFFDLVLNSSIRAPKYQIS